MQYKRTYHSPSNVTNVKFKISLPKLYISVEQEDEKLVWILKTLYGEE